MQLPVLLDLVSFLLELLVQDCQLLRGGCRLIIGNLLVRLLSQGRSREIGILVLLLRLLLGSTHFEYLALFGGARATRGLPIFFLDRGLRHDAPFIGL